jgi:hypothetical protein
MCPRTRTPNGTNNKATTERAVPVIETDAGSPGWWLHRLLTQLAGRQDRLNRLDRYYRGDASLPEGSQSGRSAYRQFQRKSRTNFAELIVEAVRERMQPTGFRTGASGDELGDAEAWRIWQANSLDADSSLVHRAQLALSDAYVIVGDVDPDLGAAVITPEDPRQVITVHDPMRRRRVTHALKAFTDPDLGADLAYLYFAGEGNRPARRLIAHRPHIPFASNVSAGYGVADTLSGWDWVADDLLPISQVPVVRFANRADMAMQPAGEFENVIDILDRINHMLLQRLVIATVQAFKQRGIKGVPSTDIDGNEIDYAGVFTADPGAMWLLPEGAEIWESGQVDLNGILLAVRHDIQDLAAVTRIPMHYFSPDAAKGSAEGASLMREGLVAKVKDRTGQTGESWEQVMSLAFAMAGDTQRAKRSDMECLWAPPDERSLAERFDAASKAGPAGVPWRAVMQDVLGFSPQQVARMETERATDAADIAAFTARATTPAL